MKVPTQLSTLALLLGSVALVAFVTGGTARSKSLECPREKPLASRAISQVVTSSSSGRLYVITRTGTLYVTDDRVHWVRRKERAPGWVMTSLGTRRDVLFAGASTGLFVSNNAGESWHGLACGWIVTGVAGVDQDPGTVYVATGTSDRTGRGGGIFRTHDGGKTWRRLTNFAVPGFSNNSVDVVIADPVSPRKLFIGTEVGGILRSSDGGDHWRFNRMHDEGPAVGGPQLTSLAFGPGPRPQLWAGSRSQGIFSDDRSARRWTLRGFRREWIDQVVPDQRRANIVFAVTGSGVVRSVDGGRHWQPVKGLPRETNGLVVQPKNDAIFAWARRTVFESRDHGIVWAPLPALP
jgi:photosystem II stability/assembly factor-like uncharacterized protein